MKQTFNKNKTYKKSARRPKENVRNLQENVEETGNEQRN